MVLERYYKKSAVSVVALFRDCYFMCVCARKTGDTHAKEADIHANEAASVRMLAYAGVCWRMLMCRDLVGIFTRNVCVCRDLVGIFMLRKRHISETLLSSNHNTNKNKYEII